MSNFKPCMYCKNSNGFTCQQCFQKKLYEYDQERADEYAEFEKEVRADERAKIKEAFKIYQRLELKFTLSQCKEKDGLYYLDVTELINGLVDQVIGNLEEQK